MSFRLWYCIGAKVSLEKARLCRLMQRSGVEALWLFKHANVRDLEIASWGRAPSAWMVDRARVDPVSGYWATAECKQKQKWKQSLADAPAPTFAREEGRF